MNTTESKYYLLGQAVRMRLIGQTEPEWEWETLFEGMVEIPEGESNRHLSNPNTYWVALKSGSLGLDDGETVRLTVNGEQSVLTCTITSTHCYFGNRRLQSTNYEDTGFDYLVYGLKANPFLYTWNPGTYAVKIERVVS